MAFVITQPCVNEKYARCVSVCPENAIETDEHANQYFINPDKCTECRLCDLTCPAAAIFPEDMVPKQWKHYIELNRAFFEAKKEAAGDILIGND
ncbi:4Fe-4S dicluster domain-containing protein [Brevibacillus dissolubilis]|uniref:4Fe-4S dicluster domain-containing protein n=1 Tax=Brevibacillus dissolubilis TaxID=1844116 RepID=UPI0011162B55|nr:4Fe-4S binding protein [Brevibacillus dissolubilis]